MKDHIIQTDLEAGWSTCQRIKTLVFNYSNGKVDPVFIPKSYEDTAARYAIHLGSDRKLRKAEYWLYRHYIRGIMDCMR